MAAEIHVAPASHPRWGQLVSGELRPTYACLALKLMMIRIRHEHERRPEKGAALAEEVRHFFIANMRFAATDYRSIFGEVVA